MFACACTFREKYPSFAIQSLQGKGKKTDIDLNIS